MKPFVLALSISLLAGAPTLANDGVDSATQGAVQIRTEAAPARLALIKKVFVAPLGTAEGSELIRQKVINRLVKDGTLSVVTKVADADAVLTGEAEVSHRHYFFMNGGFASSCTKYSAEGVVRLVGEDDRVLWLDELGTRRFFRPHSSKGASSNIADKLVKRLTEAIAADRNQLALNQPNAND